MLQPKNRRYRYSLGKLRGICPKCGKKTFKFYVDNETGKILNERCGRCNREFSCQYHLTPKECVGKPYVPLISNFKTKMQEDYLKPSFIYNNEWDFRGLDKNNLFKFLLTRFSIPYLHTTFVTYRVTHSNLYGNATEFPLIDVGLGCRSKKIMAYGEDGHRIKSGDGRASICWRHKLECLPDFNYVPCFFGEHLTLNDSKDIIIVESEKTALILDCHLKEVGCNRYVVLASGGKGNIKIDKNYINDRFYKLNFIKNRNIVLIPDADSVDAWQMLSIAFYDFCKSVAVVDVKKAPLFLLGSDDIGDYILKHPRIDTIKALKL